MSNIQLTGNTMLDLWRLKCFVAVAETEHVGAAAEALHISPSPLSRQIRQLEDELRVALFERKGKRLQITSSGREFLRQTKEFLDRADRLERDGKRLSSNNFGPVTVGYVQEAILIGALPRALKLVEDGTEIKPVLRQMRTLHQLTALEKSKIDIGIMLEAPVGDSFQSYLVGRQEFHVIFSKNHNLSKLDTIKIEHIMRESWVGPPFDVWWDLRDLFLRHGNIPHVACETFDIAASLALVADGIGFTVAPSNVRRFLNERFVTTKFPISTFALELHAVCLKSANHGATSQFLNALQMQDIV